MASWQELITAVTSALIRLGAYVFLRWIPGHPFPPIIYTLFALYIPSFLSTFWTQPAYEIVEDDIDITVAELEIDEQPPSLPSTSAHSVNLSPDKKPTRVEEQVKVKETLYIQPNSPSLWWTLTNGLPFPRSAGRSLLSFMINTLLVVAVTDLTYRSRFFHDASNLSFARVGYVAPTEANLLVREPDLKQLPIFVNYRLAGEASTLQDDAWKQVATIQSLGIDTDYTAAVTFALPNYPDRTYQWATSNNHTGFFTVPPRPGQVSKHGSFTFLTSSCIKARFPYNPFDHPLSIPGFKYMADVMRSIPGGAQFMLFLGDFIYIDVPHRFGTNVEDYRREYRQVYESPDWASVGQNLSWIHVLDDHEIANDWDRNTTGVYRAAADPWHHYQTSVNPPKARQAGFFKNTRKDATYFEYSQGPASFFMMDTRTYRNASAATPIDQAGKTMLGAEQLEDLLTYLKNPEPKGVKWKVVVSSVPFTKNWRVNALDSWAGYLRERQIILEAMWDVGLRGGVGVVILSGDRHEFAATAFPPPKDGRWPVSATVNEFSTSPLSQFYLPVHTYRQTDDDIMVKYIPNGNSKLGAITIENTSSDQSVLKFRLFINGIEAWSSVLLSPPAIAGKSQQKDSLWG